MTDTATTTPHIAFTQIGCWATVDGKRYFLGGNEGSESGIPAWEESTPFEEMCRQGKHFTMACEVLLRNWGVDVFGGPVEVLKTWDY
ncbi:MAG: hypothetical protein ACYTFV_02530 [Planctomycetota bacterium]|jgi:hypothetical protein